jgi:hypothetical protein
LFEHPPEDEEFQYGEAYGEEDEQETEEDIN